jgi:hypothetical protein
VGGATRIAPRVLRVSHPGEKIADGVGDDDHNYQEDFVTPGMSPFEASSRKQMRQIPK